MQYGFEAFACVLGLSHRALSLSAAFWAAKSVLETHKVAEC